MKGLKIFNIIFFCLICAAEAVMLYYFSECFILLFSNNIAGILVSILVFFPYFIVGTGTLVILSIIMTITARKQLKKQNELEGTQSKFCKVCMILPWVFVGVNFVLFIAFFIIGNLKK